MLLFLKLIPYKYKKANSMGHGVCEGEGSNFGCKLVR